MAHKSKDFVTTQIYALLSVFVVALGIAVNYVLRPDLFSLSVPYSLLGATQTTAYVFFGSLIIAGLLFLYESHYIQNRVQRYGCYSIALGFVIVAAIPIEQGDLTDFIHGIGTLLALLGLLVNLSVGVISRSKYVDAPKRAYYAVLFGVGLSSALISILSGDLIGVLELQGYAEYSGLAVFAGWVLVDFGDKFIKRTS